MTLSLAPIALFAYKRPWHTQQTIEALQRNELAGGSSLFVFSDGARFEHDQADVRAVRNYLHNISGFHDITVVERNENLGLANSVISGVTDIVNRYGKVIVLEDDMVTSPHFLRYMNEGLELYKNDREIISIHGYIYPLASTLPETFFLKGADCWGWGTWRRGWSLFEADGEKLLSMLKERNLLKRFNLQGAYPFSRMLRNQINNKNDSWAIRWHASAILHDKLTLYPGKSLVRNIGLDSSGMHCRSTGVLNVQLAQNPVAVERIDIAENEHVLQQVTHYFSSLRLAYIKDWFRNLIKKCRSLS